MWKGAINERMLLDLTLILFNCLALYNAADCPQNEFGHNNPDSKDKNVDTTTGIGYQMRDTASFAPTCCGVVDNWQVSIRDLAGTQTLFFQVWRPTTGNSYELVGQNEVTVTADGEQDFPITVANRITFNDGDYFGWWTSGTDIISYKDGNAEYDNNYMMSLPATSVSTAIDWSSASLVNERSYAFRVDTIDSSDPSFTNLPQTVTIPSTTTVAVTLFTATTTDVDTYDVSTHQVTMTTSTTRYSFDSSTNVLTVATALPVQSGTDLLSFKVTDQCDKESPEQVLTIVRTNQAPTITSLPASGNISEDATALTLLHTITATDPDGNPVSCLMDTGVTGPFSVQQISGSSSYAIYSNTAPGYDYTATNQYTITVDCTDTEYTDSADFTLYILKNAAPVFLNLQNSTSVSALSAIGTTAFIVLASDAENDDLAFNMTCTPNCDPFQIFDSGEILMRQYLGNDSNTPVGYNLYITVADARNTVGPSTLTITITDINDPVSINNLPVTKVVQENTAAATSIYDVEYSDLDTTQTHSFSITSAQSGGLTLFSIDSSTGLVTVATSPDFDTLTDTEYTLTITVSDSIATDSGTLIVHVTNVNEAPSFSQAGYTLSTTESSAGDVIGTPSFGVTDPDNGDTSTLTIDCGTETGYLSMNSATGQVSFQSNYDLDVGSLPTTISCTVTVTDSGGLTDTATLTINIDYVNDNTPVFSPASYTFHVGYYDAVGTSIGQVTANDGDASTHGVLTYTLDQTSLSHDYFSIDNTGDVTVQSSLVGSPLGYATTVTISSTASDIDGLSDTANIIISISDTTTTSTTTTTDSYKKFYDDPRNIAWFTLCVVLLAASMGLLGYIICTGHGLNDCRPSQLRKRTMQWKPRRDSFNEPSFTKKIKTHTVRNPPPHSDNHLWKSRNKF